MENPVFTSIVHAFVCSRIDNGNFLLIGLHKARLSPIQTVLNASSRLIARLPRFSHVSSLMTQQHSIQSPFLKSQLDSAPKYFCDHIRPRISVPLSAVSALPNAYTKIRLSHAYTAMMNVTK